MSISEYALKNKIVIYYILLLVFVGGVFSYFKMGKLEDSVFTVKTALVITRYPGASPHEVEQEVTEVIEKAAQEMNDVDEVFSSSYAGMSIVQIEIDEALRSDKMPQIWDILRKKVKDVEHLLPKGVETPNVVDDFGDVYGMFYAITGDGIPFTELNDYAQYIRQELVMVDQVGKITLFGNKSECLDIIIEDAKISELGINPGLIIEAINSQAKVAATGKVELKEQFVRVTGNTAFQSIAEIENTIIQFKEEQFLLKDIARIKKSFLEPERNMMRHNANDAIGIAVSTAKGGNVLKLAENLEARIEIIKQKLPLGVELTPVYHEAREVVTANRMFIVNLLESVGIVVLILLLSMGFRSGILIGSGLIFSILGTLLVMFAFDISLHRTSLAAIIITMGMLVDNAIVVTDGALVSIEKGINRRKAIINISKTTALPLLGATLNAILAFMPVYLAPNTSGEITRDLFLVIAISLSLSWIFAMTQTAIMNERFLKASKKAKEPNSSKVYLGFEKFLVKVLKYKWMSLATVIVLLLLSGFLSSKTKKAFFLPLDKSYMLVDYWLPEGSTNTKVLEDLKKAEKELFKSYPEIKNITTSINETPPRYLISAIVENYNTSFGQLMIETHATEEADLLQDKMREYFGDNFPQARVRVKGYISGPPIKYKVEARFIGPDPAVLRNLAAQAKDIMYNEPACGDISDNWRNKVLTWNTEFSPMKANKVGATRTDMGAAILRSTSSGFGIGLYREHNDKLPIMLKVESNESNDFDRVQNTGVWPRRGRASVPLKEVIEDINVSWENNVIQRYNRQRAITVQCDPVDPQMTGATLLSLVKDKVEAIPLPLGYSMMWDGELKPSTESNEAVGTFMPLAMLLMTVIIVMLFNSVRQSIVVLAMIPLSAIGVFIGLYATNSAFGFMAIAGFLGLIGMVLKNGIVLMDQIKINTKNGDKSVLNAVVSAAISRVRPVVLAAGTTILGMLPIITDTMYGSMAVAIIFGLLFATLLTLFVLPLLYVLVYRVNTNTASIQ